MKFIYILALAGTALAYPGMGKLMGELLERQGGPTPQPVMIGDLVLGATSPVGNEVQKCLLGTFSCENLTPKASVSIYVEIIQINKLMGLQTYVAPQLASPACRNDTCCVWNYIQSDLVQAFTNPNGTCNALARSAVRLGFHDAAAWSTSTGFGGADGSLVLSGTEINRYENNGLQEVRQYALTMLAKYHAWGVGAADLVQFMHNVASVSCPLGPRILTFVGRPNRSNANPPGLIPNTNSTAEQMIELFGNKTFSTNDLLALIGAHTVATQSFVDPSKAGQPLDSTPGVWDVKFYSEMLTPSPPPYVKALSGMNSLTMCLSGVFRLPSDQSFASDPTTNSGFQAFVVRLLKKYPTDHFCVPNPYAESGKRASRLERSIRHGICPHVAAGSV